MLLLTQGNALQIPLADNSVHCVVTSPPYWGLRDYGIGDQLGLEPTPEQFVENMVAAAARFKAYEQPVKGAKAEYRLHVYDSECKRCRNDD